MSNITSRKQLGKGWSLPLIPDERSKALTWASGHDKVQQSIYIILDTEPGERLMRPEFGCGLRRHIMNPNTVANRALIQYEVEQAIDIWEPRVELTKVSVTAGNDPSMVLIQIQYKHQRDGSAGNLVYPFYLEQS